MGEIFAGDQLHHQEPNIPVLIETVDRRDVRVVELRQQLCFALEARQPFGVCGEVRRQNLDRDVTVEMRVARLPDHTHPALADLLDQAVVE